MSYADAGSVGVRRFEVFTGAGERRNWTRDEKATIIAESHAGVQSVCAAANRHGLRHTQLFAWRREMRRAAEAAGVMVPVTIAPAPEPLFVPAVIEPEPMTAPQPAPKKRRSRRTRPEAAAIELVIDGMAVRGARGADAGVIAAVIDALKIRA